MLSASVANRPLQFERLEGRALMSAAPLASDLPTFGPEPLLATNAVAGTAIAADEFHGLTAQESQQLQALAARGNPAAQLSSTPPAAYKEGNGNLIIHGCKGHDQVVVGGNQAEVTLSHMVDGGWVVYGQKFSGVKKIIFLAYDGDNQFFNNSTLPSLVLGGAGADMFRGSHYANDTFFGVGGRDKLEGMGGSDSLYGGTEGDRLVAGPVSGSEFGTRNVLKGGLGNDELFGGGGWDEMYGNAGNDSLSDPGHGILRGGQGDDTLWGIDNQGAQSKLEMHGGAGNDTLYVKAGVYPWKLWPRDDYSDDDAFRPRPLSLADVDAALVQEIL